MRVTARRLAGLVVSVAIQRLKSTTPPSLAGKMRYVADQEPAGAFFWELSGDTANGELITAIAGR